MEFQITGLEPAQFSHLYGMSDEELAKHGARRKVLTQGSVVPDRIELWEVRAGESAILLNYLTNRRTRPIDRVTRYSSAREIVYTSPSLTGVRAAASAGLAITPLPASAVTAGLHVLGLESGLPLLPDLEFAVFERSRPDGAVAALTAVLVSLGQTAVRPTAS